MFTWSEQHLMLESALRAFFKEELEPHVEALENGEMLPYPIIRKMLTTFGMVEPLRAGLQKRAAKLRAGEAGGGVSVRELTGEQDDPSGLAGDPAIMAMLGKEAARVSPGFFLSMAAQMGLCGFTLITRGNAEQIEKYAIPVMTLEKIGAWGMTEPNSGSDAFALQTVAREDGDDFVLNGSKTFITNAPHADIFVIYAKIDGARQDKSRVYPFVVERGMPGLSTSEPMDKMGMRGSPTGEVFLDDVRVPKANLLGSLTESSREQAKAIFEGERSGTPYMAMGIMERCLEECVRYSIQRKQFGRPIADFQLVQARLAKMFVAYENVRNMAFKQIWLQKKGKGNMRDACAAKYYCAEVATEVALEAVQLMGGAGYMREMRVERLMRDAQLLRIGGGTSDIQLLSIARDLLRAEGHEISLAGPAA